MRITLDARLSAAAELVSKGGYLCDVGTDHAYLPCALAMNGKISGAMAMDVNPLPLENAKDTITKCHLTDRIVTRLSDGLDALEEAEQQRITDIAICGMGGELIDTLISRADWLKNANKSLILQPMTHVVKLREQLYRKGFAIEREIPIVDKNHLYSVMLVRYTGQCKEITPLFAQVGLIPNDGSQQASAYLERLSVRIKMSAMGMLQSQHEQQKGKELLILSGQIFHLCRSINTVSVSDIYHMMDEWAPFASQCSWDHSKLQTGSLERRVTGVVVALDCTREVVAYAEEVGANLIITHHPLIFDPIDCVPDKSIVASLVKKDISLLCCHTNLDIAKDGVNDCLAKELDLSEVEPFGEDDLGRVGKFGRPMDADGFAKFLKDRLNTVVRYSVGDRLIKTVALVGGAGSDYAMAAANLGADAYITGEIDHNLYLDTAPYGISLFEVGHYASEAVVLPQIREKILSRYPYLGVSTYRLKTLKCV